MLDKSENCVKINHVPCAGIAHPVERHLAKVEVASSSLVSRSIREFSSAGRASALQAEGQRFDPVNSHHKNNSVMIMVPWCSGYHVALSRRRSRVRFPSGPYDSLAQLVEQLTFNQWVTGSSPVRVIILCGFGGIGRRTRFRIWRLTAWGFKSLNPH